MAGLIWRADVEGTNWFYEVYYLDSNEGSGFGLPMKFEFRVCGDPKVLAANPEEIAAGMLAYRPMTMAAKWREPLIRGAKAINVEWRNSRYVERFSGAWSPWEEHRDVVRYVKYAHRPPVPMTSDRTSRFLSREIGRIAPWPLRERSANLLDLNVFYLLEGVNLDQHGLEETLFYQANQPDLVAGLPDDHREQLERLNRQRRAEMFCADEERRDESRPDGFYAVKDRRFDKPLVYKFTQDARIHTEFWRGIPLPQFAYHWSGYGGFSEYPATKAQIEAVICSQESIDFQNLPEGMEGATVDFWLQGVGGLSRGAR